MSPRRAVSPDGVALIPLTVKAPVAMRTRADEVAAREHTTRSAVLLRWLRNGCEQEQPDEETRPCP